MNSEPKRDGQAGWTNRNTRPKARDSKPDSNPGAERPVATVVRLTPRDLGVGSPSQAVTSPGTSPGTPSGPARALPHGGARGRRSGSFRSIWVLNLLGALVSLASSGLADGFTLTASPTLQALAWFMAGTLGGMVADSCSGLVATGSFERAPIGRLVKRETLTAGALLLLAVSIVCLVLGCVTATTAVIGTSG